MLYPSDGLNNAAIGGKWNQVVGVRWKSLHSSPLAAIRMYLITKNPIDKPNGYCMGNGGRLKWELYDDAPNGTPGHLLARGYVTDDPEYPMWVNNGGFPLIVFPGFPILMKGSYFHLVITNEDADPVNNWCSADFMLTKGGAAPDPNYQVWVQPAGSKLVVLADTNASPFGVYFADGNTQGNGGIDLDANGNTVCWKGQYAAGPC